MWLEAEKELLMALIEIVKTGGAYALYGIGMWMFFELLKIFLIGGFIWACIRLITQAIVGIFSVKRLLKIGGVTLMSEKVAKHVTDSLTDFASACASTLNELVKKSEPVSPPPVANESTEPPKSS